MGLVCASFVFWFLKKVLMRELVGGTGEMLFSQNGTRRAAAIRSEECSAIPAEWKLSSHVTTIS